MVSYTKPKSTLSTSIKVLPNGSGEPADVQVLIDPNVVDSFLPGRVLKRLGYTPVPLKNSHKMRLPNGRLVDLQLCYVHLQLQDRDFSAYVYFNYRNTPSVIGSQALVYAELNK